MNRLQELIEQFKTGDITYPGVMFHRAQPHRLGTAQVWVVLVGRIQFGFVRYSLETKEYEFTPQREEPLDIALLTSIVKFCEEITPVAQYLQPSASGGH